MRYASIGGAVLAIVLSWTAESTPIPKAVGPLSNSSDSHPFGGADHQRQPQDLDALGYVEEEYFLSGLANVYDWKTEGPAVIRTPDASFTTRVLVRRPKSREGFSGNIVVEMLNPSNLMDLNIGWAISHKQFVRNGDAWVGVTSKPIAVVALKNFDPDRYAPLSWNNPLADDDSMNCGTVRGSVEGMENGLVWDIYSQLAAWLRSEESSNPFTYGAAEPDHPVEQLYGWGYSQTGSFLYTYINFIHPRVVQRDGRPPYDGYIVAVSSGPANINQCATRLPQDDPRRQFRNVGVPVMRIMTQSDYLRTMAARRPDSDAQDDRFRNYEIAGSGHATPDELLYSASPADMEQAGIAVPPMACNEGPRSRFPNSLFFNAALRNLDLWVREAVPAPRAEPIEVENGKPVLDDFGNVRGGVRSPYVDVPISTWHGNSTGPSFCRIAGHEVPFDAEQRRAIYPTHEKYVEAVIQSVDDLVALRIIVQEDGDDVINEAINASVP